MNDDLVMALPGTVQEMSLFRSEVQTVYEDWERRKAEGEPKYESPLECSFAMWFYGEQRALGVPEPFTLLTQVEVGRYRIDFQVVAHIGFESYPLKLAVEMDGHGWHERTREQVRVRDARDRELQMDGWTVFHFSYTEFTEHQSKCVGIVYRAADTMRYKLLKEGAA